MGEATVLGIFPKDARDPDIILCRGKIVISGLTHFITLS